MKKAKRLKKKNKKKNNMNGLILLFKSLFLDQSIANDMKEQLSMSRSFFISICVALLIVFLEFIEYGLIKKGYDEMSIIQTKVIFLCLALLLMGIGYQIHYVSVNRKELEKRLNGR